MEGAKMLQELLLAAAKCAMKRLFGDTDYTNDS